jgi:phosphatidylserine synthase
MSTTRVTFVGAQMAWMLAALLVLSVLDALSLSLFFVLAFAGFLLVSEVTTPPNRTRQWRTRLRWLALLGLVGFGYVVWVELAPHFPQGVL